MICDLYLLSTFSLPEFEGIRERDFTVFRKIPRGIAKAPHNPLDPETQRFAFRISQDGPSVIYCIILYSIQCRAQQTAYSIPALRIRC